MIYSPQGISLKHPKILPYPPQGYLLEEVETIRVEKTVSINIENYTARTFTVERVISLNVINRASSAIKVEKTVSINTATEEFIVRTYESKKTIEFYAYNRVSVNNVDDTLRVPLKLVLYEQPFIKKERNILKLSLYNQPYIYKERVPLNLELYKIEDINKNKTRYTLNLQLDKGVS